ncbi:hypothetical protein ZHAS_00021824 [Anopheles sinensis]|uniref:Uncharacterized protein n=1 Tax=Anopheles sinensis TaxID=74873 RepID=A0A084WTP4_ANOSI|nr:hypothetical protein ZHAS_00021824 [Anopheles sinensis]
MFRQRFPQRTTYLPPATSDGTGGNRSTPGLLQFFNRQVTGKPSSTTTASIKPVPDSTETIIDVTQPAASEATTFRPLSTTPTRRRMKTRRPTTSAPRQTDDVLRSNPLGLIIPSSEQLNFFEQWQRQPYFGPHRLPSSSSTTTTTRPPQMVDFHFPQGSDEEKGSPKPGVFDPVTRLGMSTEATTTARWSSTQSSTSTMTTLTTGTKSVGTSTLSPPKVSVVPGATDTPLPPEEEEEEDEGGLGNRIDQKVLISLLG